MIMLLVFLGCWFYLAWCVSRIAVERKNRRQSAWFWFSVLTGPIAFVMIILLPPSTNRAIGRMEGPWQMLCHKPQPTGKWHGLLGD